MTEEGIEVLKVQPGVVNYNFIIITSRYKANDFQLVQPVLLFCSLHYDSYELESDLGSACIRKRCCVSSHTRVGLVQLAPGFGEAPGTVSHRAEVHTELMIISFLNPLRLTISISSSHTNMQMCFREAIGRSSTSEKCMQGYISQDPFTDFLAFRSRSTVCLLALWFFPDHSPSWSRFLLSVTSSSYVF